MFKTALTLVVATFLLSACGAPAQQNGAGDRGYGPRDPSYAGRPGDQNELWPRGQALMEHEGG